MCLCMNSFMAGEGESRCFSRKPVQVSKILRNHGKKIWHPFPSPRNHCYDALKGWERGYINTVICHTGGWANFFRIYVSFWAFLFYLFILFFSIILYLPPLENFLGGTPSGIFFISLSRLHLVSTVAIFMLKCELILHGLAKSWTRCRMIYSFVPKMTFPPSYSNEQSCIQGTEVKADCASHYDISILDVGEFFFPPSPRKRKRFSQC